MKRERAALLLVCTDALRIAQFIEPVLRETKGRPPTQRHVVVVAHGIFNSEFIGALLSRTKSGALDWGYKGVCYAISGWSSLMITRYDKCEVD